MQQTNKYQFNLIDRDDPFSPDPLNDNAQKLEDALIEHEAKTDAALSRHKSDTDSALTAQAAQIVQCREENAVVKLASGVSSSGATTFDLSGIDITKYGALMLLYCGGSAYLTVNGTNFCQIGQQANGGYSSNSVVWLWNFNGAIACQVTCLVYSGSNSSIHMFGTRSRIWADITSLGVNSGTPTALYGFKA